MQQGSDSALNDVAAQRISASLPIPKFDLGDRVYWFRVTTQDFGVVVKRFYGTEGSVEGLGWHSPRGAIKSGSLSQAASLES